MVTSGRLWQTPAMRLRASETCSPRRAPLPLLHPHQRALAMHGRLLQTPTLCSQGLERESPSNAVLPPLRRH
eukprot:5609637-Karenia_brevis.AAC.1